MEKMLPPNEMESAQLAIDGTAMNLLGAAHTLASPFPTPAQADHYGTPKLVLVPALSPIKRTSTINSQVSLERDASSSVSNCYFFKSRLQEYAQKAGIPTPVYETIKEGPSHEPSFRSTVIVNNVRYDSLPGFFNRKAAEQSAAEVALIELANSVDMKFGISQPVHETGLCKNLLQEYAQKMNYAIPLYECHKEEKQCRRSMYSCVLEIGGIKYIGASASTKKEAEIKVARTALLAIQSAASISEDHGSNSIYTVVPRKRKVADLGISTQETAAALKPKKGRFKKQQLKKKRARGKMTAGLAVNLNGQTGVRSGVTGAVGVEASVTDVASQVATAGVLALVEASVTDVHSLVETAGGLVQVEANVTDVSSQVETAGGLVQVEASVTDVGSQAEMTGDLGGLSVTNANTVPEPDSGLASVERMADICTSEFHDGNLENALVLLDEHFKDGGSTAMDIRP